MDDQKPAPGTDAPKMVRVRALRYHTHDGQEYHEGDTYEASEADVESLGIQRMAAREDEASEAEPKRDDDTRR